MSSHDTKLMNKKNKETKGLKMSTNNLNRENLKRMITALEAVSQEQLDGGIYTTPMCMFGKEPLHQDRDAKGCVIAHVAHIDTENIIRNYCDQDHIEVDYGQRVINTHFVDYRGWAYSFLFGCKFSERTNEQEVIFEFITSLFWENNIKQAILRMAYVLKNGMAHPSFCENEDYSLKFKMVRRTPTNESQDKKSTSKCA